MSVISRKILICPICKGDFIIDGINLTCINNHQFDKAKEGYFNLLPVQKKKSLSPGDSAEMMVARRNFLESEHYEPLVDKLRQLVIETESEASVKLDIACGEGYYTEKVFDQRLGLNLGFDISKIGVKSAAKKYKNTLYFVGGILDIPIRDASIDIALSIFTPIAEEEFSRIIKPGGKLIITYAGTNHLRELAEFIYEEFRPHNYSPIERLQSNFEKDSDDIVSFKIRLTTEESLMNLLKMTPYYWKTNDGILAKMVTSLPIDITCDFAIMTLIKKGISSESKT